MVVHNWLAFSSLCGVRVQLAPTTICVDAPNSTKYLGDSSLVKIYTTTGWKLGWSITKNIFWIPNWWQKRQKKNEVCSLETISLSLSLSLYFTQWHGTLQMFMTGLINCLKHVTVIATTINFSTNTVQNKIFRNALQCLNFPCFCFWKVVGRWHMRQSPYCIMLKYCQVLDHCFKDC